MNRNGSKDRCPIGLPFPLDCLSRFGPPPAPRSAATITLQPDGAWQAVMQKVSSVVKQSLPQRSR